jgi:hypothetical protein
MEHRRAIGSKYRHESIPEKFLDHPPVFFLHDLHHVRQKKIQHGYNPLRPGRLAACGEIPDIDKHHRRHFLDPAEPGVAPQNLLRRCLAFSKAPASNLVPASCARTAGRNDNTHLHAATARG